MVRLLVSDTSTFKGNSLIDQSDLRYLYGNGKTDKENFISNFIVEYLLLLQKASEADGLQTKVLRWEQFERGSLSMLTQLLQKNGEVKEQDVILVPCSPIGSKHWSLLGVQPQQKLLAVLDSLPGDFVKPSTNAAINKMCNSDLVEYNKLVAPLKTRAPPPFFLLFYFILFLFVLFYVSLLCKHIPCLWV